MLKISEKYWFAELRLPEAEEDAAVAAAAATPAVWRRPPKPTCTSRGLATTAMGLAGRLEGERSARRFRSKWRVQRAGMGHTLACEGFKALVLWYG